MDGASILADVAASSWQTEYNYSDDLSYEDFHVFFIVTASAVLIMSTALLIIGIVDRKSKFRIQTIVLSSIMITLSVVIIAVLYFIANTEM